MYHIIIRFRDFQSYKDYSVDHCTRENNNYYTFSGGYTSIAMSDFGREEVYIEGSIHISN